MNVAIIDDPIWRQRTDPAGDRALEAILAEGGPAMVNQALQLLSNVPPPGPWPKALQAFVQSVPLPNPADEARFLRAQQAFMTFGIVGVSVLACASLQRTVPGIATLLSMSGQLTDHVGRRLELTGQMLFDVMTPRSLLPGGVAFKSVLRTRLIHSALRHMLLAEKRVAAKADDAELGREVIKWTSDYGQPINQMELAYTLMTFSHVVLRGAVALGIKPQVQGFEDYIFTWNAVGRLLGVDEALLPASWDEAAQLFDRIKAAHAAPTPACKQLMIDLEGYWVKQWPAILHPLAGPAMFALCGTMLDDRTRDMLGIHPPRTLMQSEADLLLKPTEAGLRLAQRVFTALPSTAHVAAAFIQHWATRRVDVTDGGLNDTHRHMIEAWFHHEALQGGDA